MTRRVTTPACAGALLLCFWCAPSLNAQLTERKIVPLDGAEEDHFGTSVAVSGDFLIVGSPQDDDNGINSGSAYLFRWDGADWSQDAKLSAGGGESQDLFGSAVSIFGERALVGSPGVGPDRGAAYVFRFNGSSWVEEMVLEPSDGSAGDFFGASVSMESTFAVVGAYGHQDAAGAAYLFERTDTSWTEVAKLVASDGSQSDFFGVSVALSGNLALVGAWGDDDNGPDAGSGYVFRGDGAVWIEEAKLLADDGEADDSFGFSVALSGMLALVGAHGDDDGGNSSGSAYAFRRSGVDWAQNAKIRASDTAPADFFGYSISISGGSASIGAPFDDDRGGSSGSVYFYRFDGTNWRESRKLVASDASMSDHLGESVAISDRFVVAGADDDDPNGSNSGSTYVYYNGPTLVEIDGRGLPDGILLAQNYPNPFNSETRIEYSVDSRRSIVVRIFDLLGREVDMLVDGMKEAGSHHVSWNADGLPSGMYYYRLQTGSGSAVRTMILLR